ncbi:alpha/beta hydrolase [Streptomyces sp. A1547]|uniref:alpha/beta fold hydrolase n=1 Tax=Streptomyces sp. A1547 TaxID=2563105 RepID=UPI001F10C62A|nr:alpha/beta hydrolase [Streptomyces sp. A1547]
MMRTPLARCGVAAAVLSLTLCIPTPHAHAAAPGPDAVGHAAGAAASRAGSAARTAAANAGAELVASRAAKAAKTAASAARAPEGSGPTEASVRPSTAGGSGGLDFRACPAVEELPSSVQCASLRVPLDYARPDGPQISLTVSRVAATGSGGAARQGALVYNPGGPGASGMFFPLVGDLPEWERIGAAYDLVGYAPRGVGRSAPLSCEDPALRAQGPTQVPAEPSAAYKQQRIAAARAYARGCAQRAGAALRYYSTLDNVRDLHVLRAALGEEKLTFMGASYGTYLGAVYATLHPGHVRRMVLDSAVDPDPRRIWYLNNLDQAPGFERRWYDFRAWAARHHAAYRLGATPAAVQASYERVRDAVARTPADGTVGTGELQAAFLQAAYYDDVWPERAAALSAFLAGDPGPLAEQARPDPESAAARENARAVYTAVLCNDAAWPADWETWDRDNTELARRAPFETWANAFLNLPCAYWPVAERQQPVAVGAQPAAIPRTLVVAAERDGATPYPGALELQRRLGDGAALVTEEGAGAHGVVGGRNDCVDRHVERYLLTGDTSGWRVTCAPHPEPAPVSLDDRAARTPGKVPRAVLPPVV